MSEKFVVDLNKTGLEMVFEPYQVFSLRFIWSKAPPGVPKSQMVSSRDVWVHASAERKRLEGRPISRASVINFLKRMRDIGILDYENETCKGGLREIYRAHLDEENTEALIITQALTTFTESFPNSRRVMLQYTADLL